MAHMMTCARCNRPIEDGELFHVAHRRGTQVLGGKVKVKAAVIAADVHVHVHPCPARIGPPERYAEDGNTTCCGGGPQWGHAFDCTTLP